MVPGWTSVRLLITVTFSIFSLLIEEGTTGAANDNKKRQVVNPQGPGFPNLVNSCFINSAIQALSHLPQFYQYFGSTKKYKSDVKQDAAHKDFLERFASLIGSTYPDSFSSFYLHTMNEGARQAMMKFYNTDIYKRGGALNAFGGKMQHDAAEFLYADGAFVGANGLLPILNEQLKNNKIYQWTRYEVAQFKIVDASKSHFRERRHESMLSLIPSNQCGSIRTGQNLCTLDELLTKAMSPITVEDTDYTMQDKLVNIGDILIIKTGGSDSRGRKKDFSISYPINKELDMNKFTYDIFQHNNNKFKLQSVVCHRGTQNSGHYIAYGRSLFDNNWYEYDDTKVTKATVNNLSMHAAKDLCELSNRDSWLPSFRAVMLFYTRIDTDNRYQLSEVEKFQLQLHGKYFLDNNYLKLQLQNSGLSKSRALLEFAALMSKSADIEIPHALGQYVDTILLFAARDGFQDIVEFLVQTFGIGYINLNNGMQLTDGIIETPFSLAVKNSHHDIARLLLNYGADPTKGTILYHSQQITVITFIIINGNVELLDAIMKSPFINHGNGRVRDLIHTYFDTSCAIGTFDTIKYFLEFDAVKLNAQLQIDCKGRINQNNNLSTNEKRQLSLLYPFLKDATSSDDDESVGNEQDEHEPTTLQAQHGRQHNVDTLLFEAASAGSYDDDIIGELIGHGANVNQVMANGQTALSIAIENNHQNVAKLLIGNGANPTKGTVERRVIQYQPPISHVIADGNVELIEAMMKSPQTRQYLNLPQIFEYACHRGKFDSISYFIDANILNNSNLKMDLINNCGILMAYNDNVSKKERQQLVEKLEIIRMPINQDLLQPLLN